jgi:imidazolonepropionase-like amidohydrolase
VSRLAAAGARQIKVLVSGIVSFKEYGRVGPIHFSQEELKTIVEEAHSLGLTVMAHANSDQAVTMAASAGVDSLEHGYFISRDSLKMLAELNIPWVPTLIPVAAWSLKPGVRNINPEHRKIAERTYRQHQAMIAEASAMGITLGVGTDSGALGVQHGNGYLKELELYREAGLSPAEILQAATANGARIVGLEQGAGLVLPGSPANLIAVAGNFLKDLKTGVRLAILR